MARPAAKGVKTSVAKGAKKSPPKGAKTSAASKPNKIIPVEDTTSESETNEAITTKKQGAVKPSAAAKKRKMNQDDDDVDDENAGKNLKKKSKTDEPIKYDAVMVMYKIDESMPELQSTYNNKAGSVLLSDLFENNRGISRHDVSFVLF